MLVTDVGAGMKEQKNFCVLVLFYVLAPFLCSHCSSYNQSYADTDTKNFNTVDTDADTDTKPDADMKRFETVDTNMNFIHNSHPMFWFCSSSTRTCLMCSFIPVLETKHRELGTNITFWHIMMVVTDWNVTNIRFCHQHHRHQLKTYFKKICHFETKIKSTKHVNFEP